MVLRLERYTPVQTKSEYPREICVLTLTTFQVVSSSLYSTLYLVTHSSLLPSPLPCVAIAATFVVRPKSTWIHVSAASDFHALGPLRRANVTGWPPVASDADNWLSSISPLSSPNGLYVRHLLSVEDITWSRHYCYRKVRWHYNCYAIQVQR